MTEEKDLIPFIPGDLPEGPWLVFAPHPDDETFGMGGSLLLAREKNIDVTIIFMTSGGWSDVHDVENHSMAELIRKREAEAINVCRHLKVNSYEFWHESDREINATLKLAGMVSKSIKKYKAKSVFLPAPTELHPDHRRTAELVWRASRTNHRSTNYYTYDIGTQSPVNLLIDITSTLEQKQRLMLMYVSQVKDSPYIKLVNSLDIARTFTLPQDTLAAEGFYKLPAQNDTNRGLLTDAVFRPYKEKLLEPVPPKVSVIVRTKNRPELLFHALSSIVNQSYPCIEILVINDGGVNVEESVFEKFDDIADIHYFNNFENNGRSRAANIGLLNASGDYIAFLDDDDWLDENHFSQLIAGVIKEKHNAEVFYTGVRVINTDKDSETVRVFNDVFDRNRLFFENYIPINAVLFSRDIVQLYGCNFDEKLDCFEDWDFWLQMLEHTKTFIYIQGITANYRMHGRASTAITGGLDEARRAVYIRWSKTWDDDVTFDLLSRLSVYSQDYEKNSLEGSDT